MKFTNLLGINCFTKSEKIIEYPLELLELFIDPITLDYFKKPIVQNDYPHNVYDLATLCEWYAENDIEPLTGVKVVKKLNYCYLTNIICAMSLLEVGENKLYFHQPAIDLLNYIHLVKCAFDNNFTNKYEKDLFLLDIDYYLAMNDKPTFTNIKIIFDDYCYFNLEDILVNDIYTGERITQPILTNSNTFKHYIIQNDIKSKNDTELSKFPDCEILFGKISKYFPQNTSRTKKIGMVFKKVFEDNSIGKQAIQCLCGFNECFENKALIYLNTAPTAKEIYENVYETNDEFKKIKKVISNLAKEIMSYGHKFHTLKKAFGFVNFSCHLQEDDYSFIDITNLCIIGMKTRSSYFMETNFSCSKLRDSKFMQSYFVASDFTNCVFEKCTFEECSFYKVKFTNTTFKDCIFDGTKCFDEIGSVTFENSSLDKEIIKTIDNHTLINYENNKNMQVAKINR